jgi:beta-lactamase superfamily II metal-dependent hydrolase
MSIIKSYSVGHGDMYTIEHTSDNYTIIDCCLDDDRKEEIVKELVANSNRKGITRFISTHPDEDHLQKLDYLDDELEILNFYVAKNEAIKNGTDTPGFKRYCELRDSDKAFYIHKGVRRKWMNIEDDERYSSGLRVLWPDVNNQDYKDVLESVKKGNSPNNMSIILEYSLNNGANALWMGDLETDFMEKILDEVKIPNVNILFAPHHGRKSGLVPDEWLKKMDPNLIVLGEAPSENLDYAGYNGYNKLTQNSAGDMIFDCGINEVDIYVSNENYSVDFLTQKAGRNKYDNYLGTLIL